MNFSMKQLVSGNTCEASKEEHEVKADEQSKSSCEEQNGFDNKLA